MRYKIFACVIGALGAGVAHVAAADKTAGLVGDWAFDEGSGQTASDSSGRGNNGKVSGATFVKRGQGHALHFDGKAGVVEVAANPSLDIGAAGTISMWFNPEQPHGALFSWGAAGEASNRQFVAVFDTRTKWGTPGNELRLWLGGNRRYQTHSQTITEPVTGRWQHIAMAIDGPRIVCYRDGVPDSVVTMPFTMDVKDRSLLIGKYVWSGKQVFRGLIDEVRVYDRPLSPEEVLAIYKRDAASFGHDATLFGRPRLSLEMQPDPGRIVARVRCGLMGSATKGATIRVAVHKSGQDAAIASQQRPIDPNGREMVISLDIGNAAAGSYEVRAVVKGGAGQAVGDPSVESIKWPGRTKSFRSVRARNNLVWELLDLEPGKITGTKEYKFVQPKRRWVHVECVSKPAGTRVRVSIDQADDLKNIIVASGKTGGTQETMRFLPAGEHTLVIRTDGPATVDRITVCSIPELVFTTLLPEPHIKPHGPYDAAFIKKHVAPNVNSFVISESARRPRTKEPLFKELLGPRFRFLAHCLVPREVDGKPINVQQARDHLAATLGMSHADLSGSMADEFGISRPHCAVYADAWRKLHAEPEFADKVYYPYVGRLYTGSDGRELIKALGETGSAFALKRYLRICQDEQSSHDFAYRALIGDIRKYHEKCPGSIEHMILCFGYMSAPPEFLNVVPQANYKTYLDMQFNIVANAPEYWGTYGLMTYLAHYADEETVRWGTNLFRHYGIEGNTGRASADPFDDSRLLANGDFAEGARHWTLSPAQSNSIRFVDEIHLGWLEGRYQYTPQGDTALLMVRGHKKPNAVSQPIRNLEPGRLYSFRMITGQYQDMTGKKTHAVGISLEGATRIDDRSFVHVFHNSYAHKYGRYDAKQDAWMNYHWVVFRADGATAKVTISDWADQKQPGGPIGQGITFNFAQVHPYFEPEGK